MSNVSVVIQFESGTDDVPSGRDIEHWSRVALEGQEKNCEVTVRIVSLDEMRELNKEYGGRDRPTNVLSFPYRIPELPGLLGDVVICDAVVRREATEQGKVMDAHFAHMVVHGIFHLLGFGHDNADDAEVMEHRECMALLRVGFDDPYRGVKRVD